MMLPQDANGYLTPRPRKDRVASVRMVEPRLMVQVTISCGITLGIRWRKMRCHALIPQASAAVMNSCSRRDKIWPRTRRAMPGQPRKPRISIRYIIRVQESMRMASMAAPRMMMMGMEGRQ